MVQGPLDKKGPEIWTDSTRRPPSICRPWPSVCLPALMKVFEHSRRACGNGVYGITGVYVCAVYVG